MVRLMICAGIFILLICSSSSILVKGYSRKYADIPSVPSENLLHFRKDSKSYLSSSIRPEILNNGTKKQSNPDSGQSTIRRYTISPFNNQNQNKKRESLKYPDQYYSSSALITPSKSDLKPVYESIQESKSEETSDAAGYFYNRPTSENLKVFNDYNKKPEYSSVDLTTAIIELNKLIQSIEKTKSYNSVLHVPTNPILALILSHYGKYTTGTSKYNLYSYAASNNVLNNRPNGQYKYAIDEV